LARIPTVQPSILLPAMFRIHVCARERTANHPISNTHRAQRESARTQRGKHGMGEEGSMACPVQPSQSPGMGEEGSMACPVQPSQSPGMGEEGSMACARRRSFCLICLTEAQKHVMSNPHRAQPCQHPTNITLVIAGR
jgi:hypothetical protein